MLDSDYKVVLINTKEVEGAKILKDASRNVVKEVPDDYFQFRNVGQHDKCTVHIEGQLADDPAIYFKYKNGEEHVPEEKKFTDKRAFINVNVISTIRRYKDANGRDRLITSNVSARSFFEYDKRALSLLHKGDRIAIDGNLRTYTNSRDNSHDWFFIEINSFTANPYKSIAKFANDAFEDAKPVRQTSDILKDKNLNSEEKADELASTNAQLKKQNMARQNEFNNMATRADTDDQYVEPQIREEKHDSGDYPEKLGVAQPKTTPEYSQDQLPEKQPVQNALPQDKISDDNQSKVVQSQVATYKTNTTKENPAVYAQSTQNPEKSHSDGYFESLAANMPPEEENEENQTFNSTSVSQQDPVVKPYRQEQRNTVSKVSDMPISNEQLRNALRFNS